MKNLKESAENQKNVKETTRTPIEGTGNRETETIAEKIERIQLALISVRWKMSTKITLLMAHAGPQPLPLNSEKKRRADREIMLRDELTRTQEQLKLKAELEQRDNC